MATAPKKKKKLSPMQQKKAKVEEYLGRKIGKDAKKKTSKAKK